MLRSSIPKSPGYATAQGLNSLQTIDIKSFETCSCSINVDRFELEWGKFSSIYDSVHTEELFVSINSVHDICSTATANVFALTVDGRSKFADFDLRQVTNTTVHGN